MVISAKRKNKAEKGNMGVGQWAGWYNFTQGDIREKTWRS